MHPAQHPSGWRAAGSETTSHEGCPTYTISTLLQKELFGITSKSVMLFHGTDSLISGHSHNRIGTATESPGATETGPHTPMKSAPRRTYCSTQSCPGSISPAWSATANRRRICPRAAGMFWQGSSTSCDPFHQGLPLLVQLAFHVCFLHAHI